jgi:hypothetical protein
MELGRDDSSLLLLLLSCPWRQTQKYYLTNEHFAKFKIQKANRVTRAPSCPNGNVGCCKKSNDSAWRATKHWVRCRCSCKGPAADFKDTSPNFWLVV